MIYHTFNPSIKRFPTWKAAPSSYALACEQTLRCTLAAGREKEGELSTTSLKIEYLKVDAKCWLAEMTLVNDVITRGGCFHVFFNVCLRSRSFSLRADWQKSDSSVDEESQGPSCKLSYLFPPRHQSAPKSLLAGYYRELVSTCPCVPDRVEFWKCWFFLGQGKTRVPREKPLGARERHNN